MENFRPNHFNQAENTLERDKDIQEIAENLSVILEDCSRNNEEIHLTESALTAPLGGLSEIHENASKKYKAFLGILLFAASTQVSLGAEQIETEQPLQESKFTQSEDEIKKIEKMAGFDIVGEAKMIGRTVALYSPDVPTEFTVIHVGQIHNAGDYSKNYSWKEDITKSQTEISAFLSRNTPQNTKVFVEGYFDKLGNRIEQLREVASRINSSKSFEDIKEEYGDAVSTYKEKRSIATLNSVTAARLENLGFKEVSPLRYEMGKDVLLMNPSGYFSRDKSYSIPLTEDSAIAGSAHILSVKENIEIEFAETAEGNKTFQSLTKKLGEKWQTLEKFFILTNHDGLQAVPPSRISAVSSEYIKEKAQSEQCKESEDCQKIIKEILETDIPAVRKAIFEDREDIAIELIAKHVKRSQQKSSMLVYGTLHDFTRAVKTWNSNHPEQQFNLMTVK